MRIRSLAHCKLHLPAVTWKILSDHFQCPCDAINNFQDKLPALLSSFLVCLSLRVPQAFFSGGGKVVLVFEIIYLFSDLQVIFYGQNDFYNQQHFVVNIL